MRRRRKVTNWKRRVIRRWRTAVEWRLTELGRPVWVEDDASSMEQFWLYGLRKMASWAREKIQSMDAYFDLGLFSEDGKIDGEKGSLASYKHPKLKTPRGMKLNLEALSHRQLESAAMEAGVALQLLLPVDFWEHRERAAKVKYPHPFNYYLTSFSRSRKPSPQKTLIRGTLPHILRCLVRLQLRWLCQVHQQLPTLPVVNVSVLMIYYSHMMSRKETFR